MSKLSFQALVGRAEAIASNELLNSISGGTEDACHDGGPTAPQEEGAWDSVQEMHAAFVELMKEQGE